MEDFDPVGGGDAVVRIFEVILNADFTGLFDSFVFFLKILSFILLPLFAGGIVWILPKIWQFRPKEPLIYKPSTVAREDMAKRRWGEIQKRLESEADADFTLAIMEADSLIDDILKRIGFYGETMAERLNKIPPGQLSSLPDLREAHRIRNRIAHTPGFKLTKEEARSVLQKYKKVLSELEII